MDPNTVLILGVVAPAVGVAAVAGGARLVPALRAQSLLGAVAGLVAVCAGTGVVVGWPDLPPVDATHWPPFVALAAAGLAAARGGLDRHWAVGLLVRLVAVGLVLRLLLDATLTYTWEPTEGWLWLTGLTGLAGGVWFATDRLADEADPRSAVGFTALVVGAAAVVLAGTGSLKLGQFAGALGAGAGVLALAGLGWRGAFGGRSLVTVAVPTLLLLLVAGVFFSETPKPLGLLLALAPLGVGLGGHRDADSLFPWRGAVAGVVVALVALGWTGAVQEAEPEFVPGQY